mmetsp:Transcript_627/g.2029  ORF Transcript_627/g.2029 Transcript_627/m.2029 type:complete len:226 (-) Transcript_627:161-838(-)
MLHRVATTQRPGRVRLHELLDLVLRRLPPLTDRGAEVPLHLAARLEQIQRVAELVVFHREERAGAEGPHGPVQREHVEVVRHAIGEDLSGDPVAVEGEVLRALLARAGDDRPRVRGEPGTRHPGVAVDRGDPSVRPGDEHLEREELLDAQHDAVLALDPEREPAVVHRLARVVHLEDLPVGGVRRRGEVVPRPDAGHGRCSPDATTTTRDLGCFLGEDRGRDAQP